MTKEQKIEMFALRLEGKTLQEIGDKFGCTKTYVRQIVGSHVSDDKRKAALSKVKYPGLRKLMYERNVNVSALATAAGMSRCTLYTALIKQSNSMTLHTATAILRATGLTFEQAFGDEE